MLERKLACLAVSAEVNFFKRFGRELLSKLAGATTAILTAQYLINESVVILQISAGKRDQLIGLPKSIMPT
jgi:hypothetical protein